MASKRPPGSSGKRPDGGPPSGECRVLLGGREETVSNLAALVGLARRGRLEADTRVRIPDRDGWVRASEVPELAEALVDDDPWSAWEASEKVPSESEPLSELPNDALVPAPEPLPELPADAMRVVPEGRKKEGRFVIDGPRRSVKKAPPARQVQHKAAEPVSPQVPPRMAASSGARGMDNVIAFPSPVGPTTLGPHALAPLRDDPVLDLPVLKVPTPAGPRIGPRWGMLALVALGAFGLVGAVHSWVRHVAGQTFVPPVAEVAVAPVEPVEPAAAVTPPEVVELDELTVLDQQLRSRMRSEIGAVVEAGDLEAALYVDLSRMGLADLRVDAVVTSWAGKKNDVPRSAEVQVGFRSRAGELDRELAAVGLIVGRYIQSYGLDLARFEVLLDAGDAGVRRWPIDPAQSRNYYIQRVSLPDFLTNMRRHGGR